MTRAWPKGYNYRYAFARFEKDAKPRTIAIIVVLAGARAGAILLVTRFPKPSNKAITDLWLTKTILPLPGLNGK